MPIMLSGNALSLFNKRVSSGESYDVAVKMLRSWFNSKEKQTRLLREWQGMRLSEAMEADAESSQI